MKRSAQSIIFTTGLMAAMACASTIRAAEPVAVVSISGVNNLVNDIKYLSAAAGAGHLGQMAETMSQPFMQGISRDKPVGLIVSFENNNFEPLAFIPIDDLDATMDMLSENLGKPRDSGNGVFEIAGPQPSYLKEQNGWAFVATNIDALKNLPANPKGILDGLNEEYDIAIRANIDSIPKEYRDMALDQMRAGIRQGLDRLPGESDEQYELRKQLVESQMEQMNALFNQTDQITFGWLIDGQQQMTHMDMTVTAKPGTDLANQMGQLKSAKSKFAGFMNDEAAITMNSSSMLRPQDIAQTKTMLSSFRETAIKEIENDDDLPDQDARNAAQDLVGDLFDILDATLESGVMDAGLSISLDEQSMTMVGGLHVADGNAVEESLKKLVKLAKQEPDFPGIQFNAQSHGNVRFHTMQVPIPEGEDAREILGEVLDVAIGIDKQAAYFAMGNDCITKLKQVIDNSAQSTGKIVDPFTMQVALTPIAEFVASIEENPLVGTILDTLKNSNGKDHVLVRAFSVTNGATYRMKIEDGVLKAIGQGAVMAQAGGGF